MHEYVKEEVGLCAHDCIFVSAETHSCIYFTYAHYYLRLHSVITFENVIYLALLLSTSKHPEQFACTCPKVDHIH